MLQITLPAKRVFDERTQEFVSFGETTLKLEHSLISIHRWEAKWHKSYLANPELTMDEARDYVRCMSLDPNISTETLYRLTRNDFDKIRSYIQDPMTATVFSSFNDKHAKKQIITAELVYYWMISYNIPMECSKWHFNQLMTLIRICGIKNSPKKKDKQQVGKSYAELNKARRAMLNSSG